MGGRSVLNQPSVGDTSFEELAESILELEPRVGHEERAALVRDRAALMVDSLLVRVVRGQGAVDLAIGRDLHALSRGKKLNRLGYVRLGDYARERLGIPEGTAREMVRLAKGLESYPALRRAVWSGEVEPSKALAVLPVVTEENEAGWLEAVRKKSVRELRREVREAPGGASFDDEAHGAVERMSLMMKNKNQAILREALDLARELEGATAPRWMLLEALAAEFIGSFASVLAVFDQEEKVTETGDHRQDTQMSGNDRDTQMSGNDRDTRMSGRPSAPRTIRRRATRLLRVEPLPPAWIDECCDHLREWTDGWSFLEQGIPPVPGVDLHTETCPFAIDERLQKLARMRDGWGELTGRLALIIKIYGLWRDMQFVSFAHYCNQRLASSARTIEQRAFLERSFFDLPGLREALRNREIHYSKALVLASTATAESIEERIRWAKTYTCKEMRNAIADEKDAEEQKARNDPRNAEYLVDVDLDAPMHTVDLLSDAIFAAEAIWKAAGLGWMRSGDALGLVAEHFIEIWKGHTGAPRGKRKEILGRHRGQCCVPTCTLPAEEQHHVIFRSRGGGDEKENQVGICVSHHDDLHDDYLRTLGRVGSRVVYELGLRNGIASEVHVREY